MHSHPNKVSLYWRLFQQVKPYWRHLTAIFLLGLLAPPLALLTPLPLKIAVDSVIGSRPLPPLLHHWLPQALTGSGGALLAFAVGLVICSAVLSQLRESASALLGAYTGEKLLRSFRAAMFRHLQRLSLSYHDTKGTADSTYRIQYDAVSIQHIAVDGIVPFLASALTLISMIYVTARINWRLALVALAVSPVIFVLSRTLRPRLKGQSSEVRRIESSALSIVQEALGAARVVKAFGQEEREGQRFVTRSNEGMRARLRLALIEGGFGLVIALVTAIGMGAVLFLATRSVQSGAMTQGELIYVMGLLAQLYAPLKTLSKRSASMQNDLAGAERAFALLDESPDVAERPHALHVSRARGDMRFRNVSFAYDESRPVLRDVSFHVEPGSCLGISGTTGAGKTTLVNLLTRFYDPTEGEILLDEVDLRKYKLACLRNQFAIVLQEPVLFSTTIAENIAYGRSDATESEIIEAAAAAKRTPPSSSSMSRPAPWMWRLKPPSSRR